MNNPVYPIDLPEEEDKVLIDDIWQSIKRGHPCGDNRFIIKDGKATWKEIECIVKGKNL
jgi:hypothetical protein